MAPEFFRHLFSRANGAHKYVGFSP